MRIENSKIIAMSMVLIFVLLLASCANGGGWDSGDMKEVELVTALAVDKQADYEDEIAASVQLLNRDRALERQYNESYYALSADGENLAAALGEIYRLGARQLNFSHTSLLLLGENAADCAVWLDYVQRSSQLRPTLYPVVCTGAAADLLQSEEEISPIYLLNNILEPLGSNYQGAAAVSLQNFLMAYYQPGIAPALPWVQSAADGVRLAGFSVYDEGQASSKISGDAALGWLLLTRYSYLQGYDLALADGVVLQISRAQVSCSVSDNLADLQLDYRLDLQVKVLANPQNRDSEEVGGLVDERLQEVFAETLAESRCLQLDFPGFGCEICRKRPELWQKLASENYLDIIKPRLEVCTEILAN